MARRGENIYKRKDGRWEGRYIKGRKKNGKPQYGYVYARKYSQVRELLAPLRLWRNDRQRPAAGCGGILREYAAAWLQTVTETSVKISTLSGYQRMLRLHILPLLGDVPLDSLRRQDMDMLKKHLVAKKLGDGTVRNILRLLAAILRQGIKEQRIDSRVLEDFSLPKTQRTKTPVLNRSEQEWLEREAGATDEGVPVMLALYTGMRLGEICALRWEDVDLREGVIHVRQTVQRLAMGQGARKTALCFGTPKTRTSRRIIPLPAVMAAYLQKHREKADGMYVAAYRGGMTEPRTVQYRLKRLLRAAGIGAVRFHALRHTFAVRCMEQKMDVSTLSQILGHASVKMTLDVYTDSLLEHKKKEMQALNGLWTGGGATLSA